MMMLLLAFMGVAKAEVVTIGDGTSTTYVTPFNSLWGYSFVEQIFTADEIGTAGTINAISFNLQSASTQTNQVEVFMKAVTRTSFSGSSDYETVTASDMVFSGTVTFNTGWTTITLDTPFEYDGTSNLMIGMHEYTSGYSTLYFYYTSATDKVLSYHSDSANPDPYNLGSYSGNMYTSPNRANIQIDITTEGGGGGGIVEDQLHVKYMDGEEEVIDSLNLGVRPINAWMEPFEFTMYTEGRQYTVTVLDFTPSDGMFSVEGEELPFQVVDEEGVQLTMATNVEEGMEPGIVERQFVAITEGDRSAHIWPLVVEFYEPGVPDVWELACEEATEFPFVEIPATAHNITLHNDYTLPFPEIPEGYDAVYKLEFENDVMLNAEVTQGENGKVALYTEDFFGEGGPMATNYYTGGNIGGGGGGGATGPYNVQIGDGTSTTGYLPMYYLYNYSLSTQLYLGTELAAAGATSSPMSSISWYSESTYGYNIQNVSIWMANVTDTEVTATSPLGSGMTLVYQGNHQEVVGWNEFVFNQGNFAWDGHSNVLVMTQMNNGSWSSSISWQCHNAGFNAGAYVYQDGTPYSAGTTTYSLTTTTNRANAKFRSGNRDMNRELVTIAPGGYNAVAIPCNFIWAYGENEMILTADEIGTSGNITSVAYKRYSEGSGNPTTRNIDIYMKHVTVDNYASTSDWIPVTAADIVYSGNYTFQTVGEDFQTIELQTPFAYNGTDNLMICINDKTGITDTRIYWSCHYTTGFNRSMRAWGNTAAFDPTQSGAPVGGSSLTGNWVADIQLEIGAGGGGTPIEPNNDYSYGPVIENMPVAAGTYYLVASSTDSVFEVTINSEEMPCPAIDAEGFAFNPMPADNEDEVEPASVTLQWMVPTYATGWRLVFGSTYYPDPNHPQTIMYPEDGSWCTTMANSYTVRNLWNNTNYFWHVEFNNNGACPEGVSSPIWGFTTHLNVPQNLTVVDETVFDDEEIVLNWNAVVDRTYRYYFIYRDGEKIGETTVNQINLTTYTDGPLPYNMNGYTYYVTAVYDEGESAPSNEVTVKVSGRGNVNGHVYEQDGITGIAGATVTMVGQDEFGVEHTYSFTTDSQGYYSGAVYAGPGYDGQADKAGYQTAYEPVQGEPIVINYNQTTSPIDYILDESFDPVCQVIAEYYPDSLDPNSPYVKVYWGCGLPGSEIIEDFETGDFSMFDWQVDPAYPWTVTTTNPYEGTYCMKSGGAGVPSVISNMTVTVDIPADGIMSYYGKISCESNWDYGYFYIDGVQKAQYTGVSNWAEKHFDITAGTHTFKWSYTKDASVNSNDDCFYVDYICFYKQPEPPQPAQPGWHTYAEGDFNNAVGSNVGTSRWAYEYPVSVLGGYAGFNMTKVSLFSDNQYSAVGGNYTCTIYQGGNEPMEGTAVSTITVDVPSNQNAWVDFDLTTPVSITGSDKLWVVWTANSTVSSWPAGCTDVSLIEEGTWWSAGIEAGYGWEHQTYGTWTMRQYFTNRAGEGFYSYASDDAPVAVEAPVVAKGAPVMPEKGKEIVTTVCADPTPAPVARYANGNRSLNHYRVYRTHCYNDGPYTEENTVLLATVWVPDTVYIDVEWADLEPGVYKWGVGAVYEGNRGEMIEAPINWAAPVSINPDRANRDQTFDFENGQIPADWTNSAPYPWTVSPDTPTGSYCIKSSNAGVASSTSSIQATADFGAAGTVSFDANCQGEGTSTFWDHCDFSIDGNVLLTAGANITGWNHYSFPVTAGTHTFVWSYTKDSSVNPTGDAFFVDNVVFSGNGGGGGGGGGGGAGASTLNELALPRESETMWSNCLDKDMYIIGENQDGVTVNVLLNSADSPEGVQVTFTNYNEAEQELYPVDPITLDETGFYAFESFRKGEYNVKVEFDGYEPIEDSVSIWAPTDLRYVMTEIIYGVSDLYVSSTGWAMWGAEGLAPTPGPTPGPGGSGSTFSENFDAGMPAGWTTVDADGDGYTWVSSMTPGNYHNAGVDLTGTGHNASAHYVISGSYANGPGLVLYPDNYLVSPQVTLAAGSTFSFWACAQDASYAAEHFGVAVSDNGTSDWTMVDEWTLTAKGGGVVTSYGRGGNTRVQGNWYQKTVDLSAYAGQKYIAIRHFNCHDEFILNVDDIELTNGAKSGDRHLEYFKVMCTSIDGEPIFNADTEHNFCQVATDELVAGEHYIAKVAAVYSTGMSAWTECEWQYIPCDNYAGTVNGLTIEGNTVSWDYPNGGTPGPGPQPGQGDTFSVDFEAGLPAGWTTIDGGSPSGYGWHLGSQTLGTGYGHNGSGDLMISQSYDNNYGIVYPDNYLVSPQVNLAAGSTFSFYACAQDASYAAEHFGVFVSDNGTSGWTMVNEWTIGQKGERYSGPRGQRDQSAWTLYSVDLSNFAGQKYVAIRHFNCSDMYFLDVDDVELSNGAKSRDTEVFFNGFVTDPGAMANGADASWIKGSQSTWGPNANNASGYWLADSFTLSAATTISEIEVYGYQTGSSTTSTFTGLYAQIYNGNPMSGGSVVWGSATSNIMTATAFTNCYRGSDGETTATTRPIMSITAGNLNIDLEAGTYYLVYSLTGSGSSGPWGAPHCEPSIGNTGNGVQNTGSAWQVLTDSGAGTTYGCAMKLMGAGGAPGPGPGPQPGGDVLGAMIFVDGEWEAFVEAPTNSYTYEGDGNEVCVRMVYNGTNNLPEGNIYYSMSCPECDEFNPSAACEPVTNLNGYYQYSAEFGEAIYLEWDQPEGATSYEVYLLGELLGTVAPDELPVVINGLEELPAITLPFGVVAVYPDCQSEMVMVDVFYDEVPENDVNVALYPNPTKDNVTIEAAGMSRITVVSVLGQVVYDTEVSGDTYVMNMSQFTAGMYMVRVYTESGVTVKRVTVMK